MSVMASQPCLKLRFLTSEKQYEGSLSCKTKLIVKIVLNTYFPPIFICIAFLCTCSNCIYCFCFVSVPQGSVVGPGFLVIYHLKAINKQLIFYRLYDVLNTTAIVVNKTSVKIIKLYSDKLSNLDNWFLDNGLILKIDKTLVVCFTREVIGMK